jgi:hypothetical protein
MFMTPHDFIRAITPYNFDGAELPSVAAFGVFVFSFFLIFFFSFFFFFNLSLSLRQRNFLRRLTG